MSDNQPTAPLAGMRIVVAEDTWHTAMIVRRSIEQAGGIVTAVATRLAEIEQPVHAGCDALVMDLNLNGEMGHTLAGELARSGIKVIVVSGYRRPDTLEPRVHAFLEKPASPETLIAALTEPMRG